MQSKFTIPLIGAVVGGISGFLYWYKIGCLTGSCPIQSDPLNSSVYGLVLGGLSADLISDLVKKIKGKWLKR